MASNKRDSLLVETRRSSGTTKTRALRRSGKVPGVLFGHGAAPLSIALDEKAFAELVGTGGKNRLLSLTIDGKNKDTALIRDLQRDPLSRRILHADLQRTGVSETVTAKLRVIAVGVAEGVKNQGGVLDIITHELEVQCPATSVPEYLEIDVTHLGMRQHINAGDVSLPAAFKMKTPADTVVVSVEPSRTARDAEEVQAGAPVLAPTEVPVVPKAKEGEQL